MPPFFRLSLLFVILCFGLHSQASFELGVGTTSVTSGRLVPSLAVANYGASWGVSGFATGVQTATYYQSAYGLNILSIWSSGDFLGGQFKVALGWVSTMLCRPIRTRFLVLRKRPPISPWGQHFVCSGFF